jgi:hypothetical protein
MKDKHWACLYRVAVVILLAAITVAAWRLALAVADDGAIWVNVNR